MDKQGLLLKLTLNAFEREGLEVTTDKFAGRKNVQKVIYLLQERRLPFGYAFSWYLRGPYSPGLTKDYFRVESDLKEYYDKEVKDYRLDKTIKDEISKMVSELGTDDSDLEAAASAQFLMVNEGLSIVNALKELNKRKPELSGFDKGKVTRFLKTLSK
jgi:uncharacterized protein YwgA